MPRARILIAEDDQAVQDVCSAVLRLAGHECVGARDGQHAIQMLRQGGYDLLLTDVMMPGIGGLEACRIIRSFDADLPIVVMTGYGTMATAIDALQLGVSDFLPKPFRPEQLQLVVERALTRKRLERENARLRALMPLFDLGQALVRSADADTIATEAIRILTDELRADSASLLLLDGRGQLRLCASHGLSQEVVAAMAHEWGGEIGSEVLAQRKPFIFHDTGERPERLAATYGQGQLAGALSFPLLHQQRVLGVLNVARASGMAPFGPLDVEFGEFLALQIAVAVDNARLFGEIQQAYARLAELDHLKSEFISIASHELRSPLAIVLAYAAMLQDEATGPAREHLSEVVRAAMQLKSTIDEMVSLRHIDTGEAHVDITDVELSTALAQLTEDLGALAQRKAQTLAMDLPMDLPPVRADAQVLHLILSNLLSNAIKFTPEHGQITVAAHSDGERITIRVSDTGMGIPKQHLERIFGRFYQVEDSLRRSHGGIGLGLAIAREMSEMIDGRIWAESQEGQGSTFFLSLPRGAVGLGKDQAPR